MLDGRDGLRSKAKSKWRTAALLQLSPAFHRLLHGDFVGVFDVAAGWDAGGYSADFYGVGVRGVAEGGSQPAGCGFAFQGGAGGEDDFVDVAAFYSCY